MKISCLDSDNTSQLLYIFSVLQVLDGSSLTNFLLFLKCFKML